MVDERAVDVDAQSERIIKDTEKQMRDLTPDPGVQVAVGDEAVPVSSGDPREKMKHLYARSREHRGLVTRRDDAPDAELIRAAVAEAAGGGDGGDNVVDTNRRDRRDEWKTEIEIPAAKTKIEQTANVALREEPEPRNIEVKILGATYHVPKQDVDDAGGLEAYQKSRAANIKLQTAATLESKSRALLDQAAELAKHGAQQEDPPASPADGPENADIEVLRNELLDRVTEGEVKDIDDWIKSKLVKAREDKRADRAEVRVPTSEPTRTQVATRTETERELESQLEADRIEANAMMVNQYSDIMADPELLGLAKRKFTAIKGRPESAGRSQKEIAREAAESVRDMLRRHGSEPKPPGEIEQERQGRIERKRALPQPSRATASVPATVQERKVPSNKEYLERLRQAQGQGPKRN